MNSELEYQALISLTQDMYKCSLFKTAKYLCNYKDVTRHTHGNIVAALESPTKRKLIVAPRGSFKSSVGVTAYAIWLILNNPNIRIFISSETYVNAKNFLREIKAIIQSKYFVSVFGDLVGERWSESEITVKNRTKIVKEATVTIGSIGVIKVGAHFDVMLLDDLNSNQNSNTPENCQKIISYYRYLLSILEPDGTLSITATRYSMGDLVQSVLDNEINGLL